MTIRLRGVDRLLRLFFNPAKIFAREFEVSLGQQRYRGWTTSFIDWNILFYGAYEEADLLVLAAFASAEDVDIFLDIGANVGQHSLRMSTVCERVMAFEPNPALHNQFEQNIKLNGVKNIELVPVAIGLEDEIASLYLGDDSGKSSLLREANGNTNANSIQVEVKQGDAILRARHADKGIGLIKIDVEGFEFSVLRGLTETLRKNRPVIVLEVSEGGRAHFGSAASFVQSFPDNYSFLAWSRARRLLRDGRLTVVDGDKALSEYGNIYAVPDEKVQLLEILAGNRPKRMYHHDAWRVRFV